MDGVAVHGQCGLHDRLAQRRVRVDVAAELPRVALEQLRQCRLGDELCRVGSDDMRAEHLARLGVGNDLDKAAGLTVDDRPAQRRERKAADPHFVSFLFGLLLGQADRRDLRMRVGAASHKLLVHRRHALPRDVLHRDDALVGGGMGEQITSNHVADRVHGFGRRPHPLVDLDEAVRMRRHPDLLQADLLRPRRAAYGDEELARPDLALVGVHAYPVACLLRALDLHARPAVDAGLLEGRQHLLRDLLVLERHQPVERLEQCDLDAELAVERRELDADRARPDDADRFRHRCGKAGVVGRDDELAVELEPR